MARMMRLSDNDCTRCVVHARKEGRGHCSALIGRRSFECKAKDHTGRLVRALCFSLACAERFRARLHLSHINAPVCEDVWENYNCF